MAEPIENKGCGENRTASDSDGRPRPIRKRESDAFVSRLKEVIGDENASSFSRRCGFRESVLRGYLVEGKRPGLDYLAAIAEVGSVTIDWLATGRPPKTRAELRAEQRQAQYQVGGEAPLQARIDPALLRQCLGACILVYGAPFAAAPAALQLEHAADLYNTLLPNIGPRLAAQDLASRDARGLAEMLRGFLALNLVRPFPGA